MPTYNYRRMSTGEEWSEMRPMSEMMSGIDGVEVVILPTAPMLIMDHMTQRSADKWRSEVLEPKVAALTGRAGRLSL